MKVIRIWANGTRGKAAGELFEARPDRSGKYVLNRKKATAPSGEPTNRAVNKVYVDTLDEAWRLMNTEEYLINLVSGAGVRALRKLSAINVDYAPV